MLEMPLDSCFLEEELQILIFERVILWDPNIVSSQIELFDLELFFLMFFP